MHPYNRKIKQTVSQIKNKFDTGKQLKVRSGWAGTVMLYKTPASKLVQVSAIATGVKAQASGDRYADDSDHPGAEGCVQHFQGGGVMIIAREMDIPMNKVYSFITFVRCCR